MRKLVVFVLLILSVKLSLGQRIHPQNKQEIITVCEKFLDAFKNGKYADAYEFLKPYSVVEEYKLDTLANTSREQMNSLSNSFGKTLSFEQISEKSIKNSLIKLVYLLKFEKNYLKLRFILYNNGSGWTITNFTYNEEVDDLFDSVTK